MNEKYRDIIKKNGRVLGEENEPLWRARLRDGAAAGQSARAAIDTTQTHADALK
jgi:hypothetical protein